MTERERQQLETKLRNLLAELDAELERFRAHNPVLGQPDEHFIDGKTAREELDLIAMLLVQFAKSAMNAAVSVSNSRAAFEIGKAAIDQGKERFAPLLLLLGRHLSRLHTDKINAESNHNAIRDAEQALAQIDLVVAEAEFDFAARTTRTGKSPSIDLVREAIRSCQKNGMDEAYEVVRHLEGFRSLTRDVFREQWRLEKGNPQRGRPRSRSQAAK